LILMIWEPALAQKLLLAHYLVITGAALAALFILRQKDLIVTAFLFWFYMFVIGILMLIIYLLPGKTVWKGREYE